MYKNKVLAPIREYLANALDAHKDAGKADVPSEVHLPNAFEPWFEVKDFGTGLSHTNMVALMMAYGATSKDGSNDGIGGFGIGGKAGFAYTASFTVQSRFNGTIRTYACVMDKGEPSANMIGEAPTTEPNGLTIRIPVKEQDISKFEHEFRNVASRFAVKPMVTGVANFEYEAYEYKLQGKGWAVLNKNNNGRRHVAIMGNIAYPLDLTMLSDTHISYGLTLEMTFDIGDLEVAASREELSYDKETIEHIQQRIADMQNGATNEVIKAVKRSTTFYEANTAYREGMEVVKSLGGAASKGVGWKGRVIIGLFEVVPSSMHKEATAYNLPAYRLTRYKSFTAPDYIVKQSNSEKYAFCNSHTKSMTLLYASDKPKRLPSRLCAYYKDESLAGDVYLLIDPTGAVRNGLEAMGIVGWQDFEAVVPNPTTTRTPRLSATGGTVRKAMKLLQLSDSFSSKDSNNWLEPTNVVDIDVEKGYYIDVYRHQPRIFKDGALEQHPDFQYTQGVGGLYSLLRSTGLIDEDVKVYGVTGSAGKNHMRDHPNWTEFLEAGPKLVTDYVVANKHHQDTYVEYRKYACMEYSNNSQCAIRLNGGNNEWAKLKPVLTDEYGKWLRLAQGRYNNSDIHKDTIDNEEEYCNKLEARYPLLQYVHVGYSNRHQAEEKLNQYMKGIDANV